jgi:hypothetical protein
MQTKLLAMGAPASSIFSQIYLQQLEQNKIINVLRKPKMMGYFRYVDDILIVFENTTNITELQQKINFMGITITIQNGDLQFQYLETDCHRRNNTQQFMSPSAT